MSTAPRILLTATCAGLSGLIGVPPAGAELTDPAPTARADLYFEPGEMVADPQRDVVYLLDNTNSRVVAYDTEAAGITVAAALDGDPENGIPVVTRDGGELWVPLPSSQRIQKFSLPELRSIDVFHVGSAFYSLAEGADGNIYALNTNGLSRIDGTSGMTLSTTSANFDYYPLLKGAYGGERLFLIDRGLSGGSDTYEEFRVNEDAAPTRVGAYGSGHSNDKEIVVDELYGRIYRTGGAIYGVSVWHFDTTSSSFWPYDSPYGSAVCMLPPGDSLYGCNGDRIRRFRRSNGAPLYDYDDILPGSIMDRRLEITPNGRLLFAAEAWTGNSGIGFDGYLYSIGMIGSDHIGQIITNTAPAASAGADRTLAAGGTITLVGSVFEARGIPLPTSEPWGWWPLDGSANDSSGNGHHAAAAGVQWVPGRSGQAARITGVGGQLSLSAHADELETLSDGAVCLWFKTNASGDQVLFSTRNTLSTSGYRLRFFLRDGVPRAELWRGDRLLTEAIGSGSFNDGTWHHAAFATISNGTAIYIDGSGIIHGSRDFLDDFSPFNQVHFGRGRNTADTLDITFEGELDDLRIYDSPLTNGNIAALTAQMPTQGLTQQWRKVSGPGAVTFGDRTSALTTAEFSLPGEYILELVADDGELSGSDRVRVSIPLPEETLLASGASCQWTAPTSATAMTPGGEPWYMPDAVPSGWQTGATGIGYEQSSGGTSYAALIGAGGNTGPQMFNLRTSALIRVPFGIEDPARYASLTLRLNYDDGFVAYLNGTEVARRGAPAGNPTWNSSAAAEHPDAEALAFVDIDLSDALPDLRTGTNLLAIHGLNLAVSSSDFLIRPNVVATVSGAYLAYERWASDRGLVGPEAALRVDVEGDGLFNIDEYLFVTDPLSPDPHPLKLKPTTTPGTVEITYRRQSDYAGRGIWMSAQSSSDLAAWADAATTELEVIPNGDGTETVRISASAPPGNPTECFWRMVGSLSSR